MFDALKVIAFGLFFMVTAAQFTKKYAKTQGWSGRGVFVLLLSIMLVGMAIGLNLFIGPSPK